MIVDLYKMAANPEGVSLFFGYFMSSLRDWNEYLHNSIIISSLRDWTLIKQNSADKIPRCFV